MIAMLIFVISCSYVYSFFPFDYMSFRMLLSVVTQHMCKIRPAKVNYCSRREIACYVS